MTARRLPEYAVAVNFTLHESFGGNEQLLVEYIIVSLFNVLEHCDNGT